MRSEWISYREEIQKSIKLEKSKEIEEILSMQPLLDSLVVANSDSIKLLKNGILNLKTPTNKKDMTQKKNENIIPNIQKAYSVCKFYNRGYCKNKENCSLYHPIGICKKFENGYYCNWNNCLERHPQTCRYENCIFSKSCLYYHSTNQVESTKLSQVENNTDSRQIGSEAQDSNLQSNDTEKESANIS